MLFPPDLIRDLRKATSVAVLTGAGISAESGLQTFRDAGTAKGDGNAIWTKYRPEDLATPDAFERDPEMVWEFYAMRRLRAGEVKPNRGHYALAAMERHIPEFSLITQNVDGLHQRAGSKNVVELHGNITRIKCSLGCGVFKEWEDHPGKIPKCPHCGSNLRPDVVWFGEMLPRAELEAALKAAQTCQFFFSIGTSGLVQPAASLALMAKEQVASVVEINIEATVLTSSANYFIKGNAGDCLTDLNEQVWG